MRLHTRLFPAFAVALAVWTAGALAQEEGEEGPLPSGEPGEEFVEGMDVEEEDEAVWPPPVPGVEWVDGGRRVKLSSYAEVDLPQGWNFSGSDGARRMMEWYGNPVTRQEVGIVYPGSEEWIAVFEFDGIGYVSDDDKDDIDADDILESIRKGSEASNVERTKRGWPTIEIVGWRHAPHYDEVTQNLEWAILGRSAGGEFVNYDVRLLGRRGVMQVTLIVDPDGLDAALPAFRDLLARHEFVAGEKYGEYREGDKIAEYGLIGLIAGGAAAAGLKTGLFKKLWKLLVVAAVAVVGFLKKLLGKGSDTPRGRRRGRSRVETPESDAEA